MSSSIVVNLHCPLRAPWAAGWCPWKPRRQTASTCSSSSPSTPRRLGPAGGSTSQATQTSVRALPFFSTSPPLFGTCVMPLLRILTCGVCVCVADNKGSIITELRDPLLNAMYTERIFEARILHLVFHRCIRPLSHLCARTRRLRTPVDCRRDAHSLISGEMSAERG